MNTLFREIKDLPVRIEGVPGNDWRVTLTVPATRQYAVYHLTRDDAYIFISQIKSLVERDGWVVSDLATPAFYGYKDGTCLIVWLKQIA